MSVLLCSGAQNFFGAGWFDNLGKVLSSLRSDIEDFCDVHGGVICSLLHDCNETGSRRIVRFFALTLGYNLGTSFIGTSESFCS